MPDSLAARRAGSTLGGAAFAGVVLAAGAGTRLRPLTRLRPKALCPVGNVALVDLALDRLAPLVGAGPDSLAANVHHGRAALEQHLVGRAHLSVEGPEALGTAGALGQLRGWIDGRSVLVVNADTWCPSVPSALVDGWDGEQLRVLVTGSTERGLGPWSTVLGSLMPWRDVEDLAPVVSGLSVVSWPRADGEGRLELVGVDALAVDCGRPADYLAANLASSGGASVIGAGAVVRGEVHRSVVWPGAVVERDEVLVDAIRTDGPMTVLIR